MEKATSAGGDSTAVMIVGAKALHKDQVGNIILGTNAFDAVNETNDCQTREGQVCERRVTVVRAPGWYRGYRLCDTPAVVRMEMVLSPTLCPSGPHGFILVVNAEQAFNKVQKKTTVEHMQKCFGTKVWDHTVVVFSHRGLVGVSSIDEYICREGAPLQSLLAACGNRCHVLCTEDPNNSMKVAKLFEQIDAMVAKSGRFEIERTLIRRFEERKKEVDGRAEELRQLAGHRRQILRKLVVEPKPCLRILMLGWVFSGKSACANRILQAESFHSGERSLKSVMHSGRVAGREVVIVDTPGWWKFFPAIFNPPAVKSEVLKGVPLCSPSPTVIILAVPLDTSFTEEQKQVTEDNMKLLGPEVWRHVIVVFTFGDGLGSKTIEQHIESEGEPLRWLIEKCGNRYQVLNNRSRTNDEVAELLEKMEEMVAGNSFFDLPKTRYVEPEEGRVDKLSGKKDENKAKTIMEQLCIEWNRRHWERQMIFKGSWSMNHPPMFSDAGPVSEGASAHEAETGQPHSSQPQTTFASESESDDAASGSVKLMGNWLEREWSRREVSMEVYLEQLADKINISEPDSDQVQKSREKVIEWLKNQHATSDYKAKAEKKRGQRKSAYAPRGRRKSFKSH